MPLDQVRSRAEAALSVHHAPCARCERPANVECMLLWSERRRFRVAPNTALGGFRYAYGDRYFGVCPACHSDLKAGGDVADLRRRRGVALMLAAILAGVLLAALTPVVLPQLMSAFWQTGF